MFLHKFQKFLLITEKIHDDNNIRVTYVW